MIRVSTISTSRPPDWKIARCTLETAPGAFSDEWPLPRVPDKMLEVITFFCGGHIVTWWKGIRDVAESGRSCIEMDGDLYRFILKKANYGDGGTYIVKASNCHGSQKAYCTVRVSYRIDQQWRACHLVIFPPLITNRSRRRPILPSGISRTLRLSCTIWPNAESVDSTKVFCHSIDSSSYIHSRLFVTASPSGRWARDEIEINGRHLTVPVLFIMAFRELASNYWGKGSLSEWPQGLFAGIPTHTDQFQEWNFFFVAGQLFDAS